MTFVKYEDIRNAAVEYDKRFGKFQHNFYVGEEFFRFIKQKIKDGELKLNEDGEA